MSRSKASEIKVTFDPFRCRIRIYRNTYRALGSPKHIQFLVNPEELYFAILGLDHPMRGGTSNKVPDYYTRNTQQSIEVYSTLILATLALSQTVVFSVYGTRRKVSCSAIALREAPAT